MFWLCGKTNGNFKSLAKAQRRETLDALVPGMNKAYPDADIQVVTSDTDPSKGDDHAILRGSGQQVHAR